MSGGPADGHRVALFTSLRSHQIAELVGTRQEDPPIIVAKEGQLEQLSEEVAKQVEEAHGDPSRPSFFYEPDLDLDSSLDSETGSPRLSRRRGVEEFKVKEVVCEKEAMESELGRRLLERARSAPAEHAPLGVHKTDATKLLAMSLDSKTWAELTKTIDELEAEEPAPQEEPASSTTAEQTVTITVENAKNIGILLQRCEEEGGSLAEKAGKAEPIIKGLTQAQTEEVLVGGREMESLQQLGTPTCWRSPTG